MNLIALALLISLSRVVVNAASTSSHGYGPIKCREAEA